VALCRSKSLIVACALLVTAALGCGGGGHRTQRMPAGKSGQIVVQGTVTLRGTTPFQLLFLETGQGEAYMVQASPVADELERLSGMSVAITGELLPVVPGEPPVVAPTSYEMLPLVSGDQPIVGEIGLDGGECVLHTTDGKTLLVTGEFASLLNQLEGAKVWVVGTVTKKGRSARSISVVGYQVIRPPGP